MSASQLRLETTRELYRAQRERREGVRNSVATPVAALAFSIFDLSTLAANFRIEMLDEPVGIAIAMIATIVVLCLLVAAALIIRVERNFIYLDPPDLEELLRMEKALKDQGADNEKASERLHDLLAGAYDIVYRQYFAANERAARDRTRGLRLILISLALLAVAFLLLPFVSKGAQ